MICGDGVLDVECWVVMNMWGVGVGGENYMIITA